MYCKESPGGSATEAHLGASAETKNVMNMFYHILESRWYD
jgi:hypothetical protein